MANVQHSALTDPNIHEPKGIAAAASGKVYVSNGSGSGSWQTQPGHAYGEIYISGNSTAFTLAAASAASRLNPTGAWTTNGYQNITPSPSTGQFTIINTGVYKLNFWATFETTAISSSALYNFYYAINGTPGSRKVYIKKISNGVDVLHISAVGFANLNATDTISMFVSGDGTSSGTNIVVAEAGFSCLLIDPV